MSTNQPPEGESSPPLPPTSPAAPPPMPPAPPAGAMPPVPPSMPPVQPNVAPGQPPQSKGLQITALVAGILSFLCLPVLGALVAIITGFMGRSKAKKFGESSGMAVVGIVLGVANLLLSIILSIVIAVAGLSVFGFAATQIAVSDELARASVAAEAYGIANGSYSGLDETVLQQYGYTPSNDVMLYAYSGNEGTEYCVEAALVGSPDDWYHAPVFAGDTSTMTFELNGRSITYAEGTCP